MRRERVEQRRDDVHREQRDREQRDRAVQRGDREARRAGGPPARAPRRCRATTLAVSRTSVIAPAPRVAYQSAEGPWPRRRRSCRDALRGPAGDGRRTAPSLVDEPCRAGRAPRARPGASSPSTIAAVLAVLASTQVAAATLTVRQRERAGRPVRGSMMWWRAGAPAPHRRARRRQAARARSASGLPGRVRRARDGRRRRARSSPPAGAGPATAMSPPRLTSTPRAGGRGARPPRRGRRPAPSPWRRGRAARRRGTRTVAAARDRAETARQPGDAAARQSVRRPGRPIARSRGRSRRGPAPARRRVDEPAGELGGAQRDARCASSSSGPTRDRPAGAGVERRELGVVAKAAAGEVDRRELRLDGAPRAAQRRAVARPRRSPSCRAPASGPRRALTTRRTLRPAARGLRGRPGPGADCAGADWGAAPQRAAGAGRSAGPPEMPGRAAAPGLDRRRRREPAVTAAAAARRVALAAPSWPLNACASDHGQARPDQAGDARGERPSPSARSAAPRHGRRTAG